MPNTRVPSGTTLSQPMSSASPAWTVDSLKNLAALTTRNLTATYGLWLELVGNQQRFTMRLLDAMGASTKAASGTTRLPIQRAQSVTEAPQPAVAGSFPIKRYDKLTVQEVAGKVERLRDQGQIRTVLAYEAKNKNRKGVIAVGEARLKRLTDH